MRDFFGRYDLFLSPTARVVPFDAALRCPAVVDDVPSEDLSGLDAFGVRDLRDGPAGIQCPGRVYAGGLPVGFQLVAYHYDDVRLLRWGQADEQRTRCAVRQPALLDGLG